MKKYKIFLSSLFILGLAACEAPAQYGWYKQGVTRKDTRSYQQGCIYDVEMNKVSVDRERKLIIACMERKGFRWVRLN